MSVLALCLVTALAASAGTADDPELEDETGDVESLGVGLGPAAASVDIVRAWFEPGPEATWVHLETLGGEPRPPNAVLTVTFDVGPTRVFAGYGRVVMPEGVVDSYYGCAKTYGAGDDHDCRDLEGEVRDGGAAFRVGIPRDWFAPGEVADGLTARTYVLEPPVAPGTPLTGAGVTFDEAGPGSPYASPAPPAAATAPPALAAASAGAAREAPGPAALGIVLAAGGAAVLAARRTR